MSELWRMPNVKYSHRPTDLNCSSQKLRIRTHTPAAELCLKTSRYVSVHFFFSLSTAQFVRRDPPGMLLWNAGAPLAASWSSDASSQCGTMKRLDAAQIETVLTKSDCEGGRISSKVGKCQGQAASA